MGLDLTATSQGVEVGKLQEDVAWGRLTGLPERREIKVNQVHNTTKTSFQNHTKLAVKETESTGGDWEGSFVPHGLIG